jgi:hypothetical protein
MPRKPSGLPLRGKLNLTIHPEIRAYADELSVKRRRSISQLVEDLIEAEWMRQHQQPPAGYVLPQHGMYPQGYAAPQPGAVYYPPPQ